MDSPVVTGDLGWGFTPLISAILGSISFLVQFDFSINSYRLFVEGNTALCGDRNRGEYDTTC